MNNSIYENGAVHNDHSKHIDITVKDSSSIKDLIKNFMEDEADPVPYEEVTSQPTEQTERKSDQEREYCIPLNSKHIEILLKAEEECLIKYNPDKKNYERTASKRLVAYLCGLLFCKDFVKDGVWNIGSEFDGAKLYEQLFGFDVAYTRRAARGNATKLPIGYERVDKLFK